MVREVKERFHWVITNPARVQPLPHRGLSSSEVRDRAIIGLCGIAVQHIMDKNYDKAEDTLRGLIMSLDDNIDLGGLT